MAYTALLTIDDLGEEYENVPVFHCEFEFNRKIDIQTGHSMSAAQAGLIQLVVDSTKSTLILDWLLRQEEKDGKIVFLGDGQVGSTGSKKIVFEKAKCVNYRETFEATSSDAMRCHFSLWCLCIDVAGSKYEVYWDKKYNQ